MERREYLAGLVGSSAVGGGCLASVPGVDTRSRNVSVTGVQTEGVEVTAEMVENTVTTSQTAAVRITWSNPGSRTIDLDVARESAEPLPSHTFENRADHTGLVLVPRSYEVGKRSSDCWKPKDRLGASGDADATPLSPGESFHHEYRLWTKPDREGCLPPDKYDFGHAGEESSAWRVTLNVETPE